MYCGLTVRRKGSAMVLLDRATATLHRLSKVTTFIFAAIGLQFWMQHCCLQPSLTVSYPYVDFSVY